MEQQNYIFDTLWNKAIPAIKRFREIEEGIGHTGTDEIYDHRDMLLEMHLKEKFVHQLAAE